MQIPGTKVQASFYKFSSPNPPLFFAPSEGTLNLASVNAGNSDGLCVGGGGVNHGFLITLTKNSKQKNINLNNCDPAGTKDDYQFRHLQLVAKATATAQEAYTITDPCAFSYLNATKVPSSATNWYESYCFVDVFDPALCPGDNPRNAAMLYMAPPHGKHYASDADFLAAIQATAVNIIRTIAGYNAIALQQGLPVIEALRNTLYSSVNYNPGNVDHSEIARAIFAGFQSELQANANTGLVELQFPVGPTSEPLFGAVESDLNNLLNQPPPQQAMPHHARPAALAPNFDPPPPGGGVVDPTSKPGEGKGKGMEPGSDPGFQFDSLTEAETKAFAKAWSYRGQAADVVSKQTITSTDTELQILESGQTLPANSDVVEAPRDPETEQAPLNADYDVVRFEKQYANPGDPLEGFSNNSLPNANPLANVVADPPPALPPPDEPSRAKTYGIIAGIVFAVVTILGGVATMIWAATGGPWRRKPSVTPTADPNTIPPPSADATVTVSATVTAANVLKLQDPGQLVFTLADTATPPVTIGQPVTVKLPTSSSTVTGQGTLTVPANTKSGSYTLTAEYTGGYDEATGSVPFTIAPAAPAAIGTATTITAPATIAAGLGLTVAATVKSSDGSALPTTSTITFTLTDSSTPPNTVGLPATASLASGTATLSVPAATKAGAYTLTAKYNGATGYAASTATQTIAVTAVAATTPVITASPSNATVVEGGTVTLTATATPATAPVQWEVSTDKGSTFSPLANQTSGTLKLSGVTAAAANNNQYRAVFGSGSDTAVTTAATLVIKRVVFLGTDTATQGNWINVYGKDGYAIAGAPAVSTPSYATFILPSATPLPYAGTSTTDPRSLEDPAGVATVRYADTYVPSNPGQQFVATITATDTAPHQLALYIVDWDTVNKRTEVVSFPDTVGSGKDLDDQTFTNFTNGRYALWNFSGSITIIFNAATPDPTLFGVFLDPYNPQPAVRLNASAAITTVGTGASTASTLRLIPANGFSTPVTLAASPAWPAGITGTFSPNPANGPATVTIAVDKTVAAGLYLLPVTATSDALTTRTLIALGVNPMPMPMARHTMVAADVSTGESVAVDVLSRGDSFYDKDPQSVVLVGLQDLGLTTAAPAAVLDKKGKYLRVSGQGLWMVDEKGLIAFLPDAALKHPPTPAAFRFSDVKGNQSNSAMVVVDHALDKITKLPGTLKQLSETEFWARFKKKAITEPKPALDAGTFLTTLITLAGTLQFVVVPGPNPVAQADYDANYAKWDAAGREWLDLLNTCESIVGKAIPASSPPLLQRYWRLALMAKMTAQQ